MNNSDPPGKKPRKAAPPPASEVSGRCLAPLVERPLATSPKLNRDSFRHDPPEVQLAVEKAAIKADRVFRARKARSDQDILEARTVWFWRVLLAYAEGARDAVHNGAWKPERMVSRRDEVFRDTAASAEIDLFKAGVEAGLKDSKNYRRYENIIRNAVTAASVNAQPADPAPLPGGTDGLQQRKKRGVRFNGCKLKECWCKSTLTQEKFANELQISLTAFKKALKSQQVDQKTLQSILDNVNSMPALLREVNAGKLFTPADLTLPD